MIGPLLFGEEEESEKKEGRGDVKWNEAKEADLYVALL